MTPTLCAPAGFSDLLLRLYRLSHERPLDQFQDATLALLRSVLPFDSSMWGTATSTPQGIDIHTLHLHRQPNEMLSSYERLKHLDTAAQQASTRPRQTLAFNADHWFDQPSQAELREHGRRHGQANFFITSDFDPATDFVHWITLFREDEDAHCRPAERELLSLLAPHVMQALTLNRIAHLDRLQSAARTARGTAICDLRGVICHADEAFDELRRREWHPGPAGRLPAPVLDHFLRGHAALAGAQVVMSQRIDHGLMFVTARPRCRADSLTPREHTVATLMARGDTYKEIARVLQRSPATVRNQIRSVYGKLGVAHVAGLIQALREAQ